MGTGGNGESWPPFIVNRQILPESSLARLALFHFLRPATLST